MIMALMVLMMVIKIKNDNDNGDNYVGFNDPNYMYAVGYDDNGRNEDGDYEGNEYVSGAIRIQ